MPSASSSGGLPALLQAYLFAEGGSLTIKRLVQLTGSDDARVKSALDELAASLTGHGLSLVRTETEATLAVSGPESQTLKAGYEKELGREVGDAGLEVLAIILYRGPSTRADIDYIRGVNTSSTIRTLLARGMLARSGNPLDGREYIYSPTTELLAHLGVTRLEDLPEYGTILNELKAFEETQQDSGPFAEPYDRNATDTDGGAASVG